MPYHHLHGAHRAMQVHGQALTATTETVRKFPAVDSQAKVYLSFTILGNRQPSVYLSS